MCFFLSSSDLPVSTEECPYPFQEVVDECFYLSPNNLAWHNARHSCQGMGADLATPSYLYALRTFVADKKGVYVPAMTYKPCLHRLADYVFSPS